MFRGTCFTREQNMPGRSRVKLPIENAGERALLVQTASNLAALRQYASEAGGELRGTWLGWAGLQRAPPGGPGNLSIV